jgi:hypothetical protein
MKSDLRNLATHEEPYGADNTARFALRSKALLRRFKETFWKLELADL